MKARLRPAHSQHNAPFVLQSCYLRSTDERRAGTRRSVGAGDVRRPMQIGRDADQVYGRNAQTSDANTADA
jgi:hypothetical protein